MSLRRLHFPVLSAAFILLLFSARCALTQPAEKPTGEDRATASRYSALVAELIAADSLARELINERDPERIKAYLEALNSNTEVEQIELSRARRFMRRILPRPPCACYGMKPISTPLLKFPIPTSSHHQ